MPPDGFGRLSPHSGPSLDRNKGRRRVS